MRVLPVRAQPGNRRGLVQLTEDAHAVNVGPAA